MHVQNNSDIHRQYSGWRLLQSRVNNNCLKTVTSVRIGVINCVQDWTPVRLAQIRKRNQLTENRRWVYVCVNVPVKVGKIGKYIRTNREAFSLAQNSASDNFGLYLTSSVVRRQRQCSPKCSNFFKNYFYSLAKLLIHFVHSERYAQRKLQYYIA